MKQQQREIRDHVVLDIEGNMTDDEEPVALHSSSGTDLPQNLPRHVPSYRAPEAPDSSLYDQKISLHESQKSDYPHCII